VAVDLPGAAHLELADGMSFLDPAPALFQAMLRGWARQQRCRFLKEDTIDMRLRLVRRLAAYTNAYPWDWQPADAEAFISTLRSGKAPIAPSTGRAYEQSLAMFMGFVTDPRYGWVDQCRQRFGKIPQQIFHEWNSIAHTSDYEGQPGRRALTYDEVQQLFDAADALAEHARARGRKGALAAIRNATLLKTVYAFGLRRREAWGLDLADFRQNPRARTFGRFGAVFVRWGRSSRGSTPKRRTVLTVPEMDWVVPALEHWITEVRPRLSPASHPALWVTERRARVSMRAIDDAFCAARSAAGLDKALDLHGLRHSYMTHLAEFGYPQKFIQDQAGHAFAATTAIYQAVSDEYRNRLMEQTLRDLHPELWGEGQ
jgi:site-specific recombinase XerD